MKKFTSMMVAAMAATFGAFAQVPEAIDLTGLIVNPSFDDETWNNGWTVEGNISENWSQTEAYSGLHNASGAAIRMVDENLGVDPGNKITQEITSEQGHGTYVLSVSTIFSRNSFRGNNDAQKWWCCLFLAGEDNTDATGNGEYDSCTRITECGWGKSMACDTEFCPQWVNADGEIEKGGLKKFYAILTTDSEFIQLGWFVPTNAEGWNEQWPTIGKPNLILDNFQLMWYDTEDTQAVKDYIAALDAAETGLAAVSTVSAAANNGKIYNMQGVEVKEASAPGLYIQNGKKFIVK